MNTYRVAPFSGKNFNANQDRLKVGEDPCAICGKAVTKPYKHVAVVIGGGGDWARTEDESANENDPGYMGVWGIGPDCHRKHIVSSNAQAKRAAESGSALGAELEQWERL